MSPVPPPSKKNNNAEDNIQLSNVTFRVQCHKGSKCKSKEQDAPYNQGFHIYEMDPRSTDMNWFCPTCTAIQQNNNASLFSGSRTRSQHK